MKNIVVAVTLVLISALFFSCASKPSAREGLATQSETVMPDPSASFELPLQASQPDSSPSDSDSSSPVEVVTATTTVPDAPKVVPADNDDASVFYTEPEPLFTLADTDESRADAMLVKEAPVRDVPTATTPVNRAPLEASPVVTPAQATKAVSPVNPPKKPMENVPARDSERKPESTIRSEPVTGTPTKGADPLPTDKVGNTEERVESGIWEAGPEAAAIRIPTETPRVAISRQVSVSKGSLLDVWYPGTGWVYLGETLAQGGVPYDTRKIDGPDTVFTFRAVQPGRYILEFSRYDVIADEFLSDALSVTVTESTSPRRERVRAPDWKSLLGASDSHSSTEGTVQALQGVIPSSATAVTKVPDAQSLVPSTGISDEPALSAGKPKIGSVEGTIASALASSSIQHSPHDSATLLREAGDTLASGDVPRALALLDAFFASAVVQLDEGWFLRGKAFEANGPSRDVRKAIEAYKTILEAWPESERWKESDARVRYLTQFYIRGR